jgi:hypothetical protein
MCSSGGAALVGVFAKLFEGSGAGWTLQATLEQSHAQVTIHNMLVLGDLEVAPQVQELPHATNGNVVSLTHTLQILI